MFRRATSRRRPIKPRAAARFDRPGPLRYPCGREERWPSGRRRTPGKCVTPNRVRGFESHPLRQHVSEVIHLLTFKVQFERRGVSPRVRQNRLERFWTREARPQGEGQDGPSLSHPLRQHCHLSVNGGSRLHLRDDWPRTPSGPEGSSGRGFKSGAEVLLARAASQKACDNT